MSKLLENISQVINLDAEEKKKIESVSVATSLEKGDKWIVEGKVCYGKGFFLTDDYHRLYYYRKTQQCRSAFFLRFQNWLFSLFFSLWVLLRISLYKIVQNPGLLHE